MMSLDSLRRAQLQSILEQFYGAEVDPEFLFNINTTFHQLFEVVNVRIYFITFSILFFLMLLYIIAID